MKTLILFASRYGATEEIAYMLKSAVGGDVTVRNIRERGITLDGYDTVIIGSCVYMFKLDKHIKRFLRRNEKALMGMSAHCNAQAGNLGDAAGHQRSLCIIAQTQTVGDTGCNGDDIFERAAQLHANQVIVDIHAEGRVHQPILHLARCLLVLGGSHHCGRLCAADLLGMGRSRQNHIGALWDFLREHCRKIVEAALLQTFCHTHHNLI